MTQQTSPRGVARRPAVVRLVHQEGVRLEGDPLVALFAELGEIGAERALCSTVEEMADALAGLQRLHLLGDFAAMADGARRLSARAARIGMTSMARVAGDLAGAADWGDPVAAGAVMARLVRVGDRSLTAIWDLRDGAG
ncbi:hypothetical protein [Frigidibacter oleivorans]|uniref:hypothetical protein n=1 Tax=Frigidibacter oleivorans TaxID=2487129 RepID=UPI000F8E7DC7|nr:hypothetical protein [Frigidibacter oleivorans]